MTRPNPFPHVQKDHDRARSSSLVRFGLGAHPVHVAAPCALRAAGSGNRAAHARASGEAAQARAQDRDRPAWILGPGLGAYAGRSEGACSRKLILTARGPRKYDASPRRIGRTDPCHFQHRPNRPPLLPTRQDARPSPQFLVVPHRLFERHAGSLAADLSAFAATLDARAVRARTVDLRSTSLCSPRFSIGWVRNPDGDRAGRFSQGSGRP